MKNKALNIFVSALVTLSAFFFITIFSLAEEGADGQFIGQSVTVSELVGKVEILPKDTLNWQEANPGIQLIEGDKIRTTEGAKAELVFKDGSFIRLKENTTITIKTAREELSTQATQYKLDFRVGEIMLELKKLRIGSSFEVETPTAVAAVRGTTYYMRAGTKIVDGVEKSFVEIYVDSDDIIDFSNTLTGESCIVEQGQGAIVYDDGTVEGPFPIPPAAQDAWKSGFDMVYDDSEGKKGMRDVGEEGADDDISGDVDDTTGDQDDSQQDADQDQTDEQDIYGLANVTIITDTDGDGIPDDLDTDDDNDGLWDLVEVDREESDPFDLDTDGDNYNDFEDAFPNDNRVDPDTPFVEGHGSWEQLRQVAADRLAVQSLQSLREDIADMVNDIHARGYEAVKETIFDHQAGKVMRDRWGNRVRVEEYVSRPTNDQVQILALNLRTAGPNAGISSFDFRTTFDRDISSHNLKNLPWGDYMSAYGREDLDNGIVDLGPNGGYDNGYNSYYKSYNGYYGHDELLIVYGSDPGKAPRPLEFSVEVKNPYGDSLRVIESYLPKIALGTIDDETIWYQSENEPGNRTFLNDTEYFYADDLRPEWTEYWGDGWNDENRHAFLDYYVDGERQPVAWLVGVFYLINDDGSLVTGVNEDYLDDDELDIFSVRSCLNPEYNVEMVFFSSVFGDTLFEDLKAMDMDSLPDYADELNLYNTYRNIDVITIPEITEPYTNF